MLIVFLTIINQSLWARIIQIAENPRWRPIWASYWLNWFRRVCCKHLHVFGQSMMKKKKNWRKVRFKKYSIRHINARFGRTVAQSSVVLVQKLIPKVSWDKRNVQSNEIKTFQIVCKDWYLQVSWVSNYTGRHMEVLELK